MEEVNWPVFQAAAALIGGKLAASENQSIDSAIERDLPDAYHALLHAARHIHLQAVEDKQRARAASNQKPSVTFF
ncbi:MAG: hypothetical protein EON49_00505 [Acidovorax sp.]|nr:MAG: hypothetical protein EON49_00505 [Acidovorax sp.]